MQIEVLRRRKIEFLRKKLEVLRRRVDVLRRRKVRPGREPECFGTGCCTSASSAAGTSEGKISVIKVDKS